MPKGTYEREPPEERFWTNVVKCDDGCWRWTGSKTDKGYGRIGINGKTVKAHRYSYEIHHPITKPMNENELVILHRCDNPACVNPAHLRLGTQQDNIDDKMIKGRGRWNCSKGEQNGKSKLNETQIIEIRNRYAAGGTTYRKLATEYGVHHSTVGPIINHENWKHI